MWTFYYQKSIYRINNNAIAKKIGKRNLNKANIADTIIIGPTTASRRVWVGCLTKYKKSITITRRNRKLSMESPF